MRTPFYRVFARGGESFTGEMLVAKNGVGKTMFYDIVNIKESSSLTNRSKPEISAEPPSTNSIRENGENVNSFSKKSGKSNSQSIGNLADVSYSASLKGRESTLKYQTATSMQGTENARAALRNIAVRFLEWVRSALKRLGGSRETQSEYKALKKAEKLLSAALENAKGGVSLEDVEENEQRKKALRDMFAQEGEGDSSTTRQNDNVEQRETTSRYALDKKGKKSYYNQYTTLAMQWAYSSKTQKGDSKVLFNAQDNTWNKIVADDSDDGYSVLFSVKDTEENSEIIQDLHREVYNENNGTEQGISQSLRTDYEGYWSYSNDIGNDDIYVEEQGTDGRAREIHRNKSESNGKRDPSKGGGNKRYSLDVNIEEKIKKHYGSTYRWSETGYIMRDGTRLDLSGRNEGARGGYDKNKSAVEIQIAKKNAFIRNAANKKHKVLQELYRKHNDVIVKQEAVVLMDELLATAEQANSQRSAYSHDWLDNYGQNDWEYWKTYIQDKENTIWEAILNITTSENGEKILYDINPIKKMEQSVKSDTSPSLSSIRDNSKNVNTSDEKNAKKVENSSRKSLDVDSEGRELTKEQAEYFKDSKVRDENGNLLAL